ncbi:hypothetical protein [Streptomyces sp. NPDC055036]
MSDEQRDPQEGRRKLTPGTITDEKVLSTLREVVEEKPLHVYKAPDHMTDLGLTCFYVDVDEAGANVGPGCVIGQVLHRLGVPLDKMQACEGVKAVSAVHYFFPGLSIQTLETLETMQKFQDNGHTWGDAYHAAVEEEI